MAEQEFIKCDVCKKEIPQSVAVSMEGQDYICHFCSPDCREHYFGEHPELDPNDFKDAQG